MANGNWKAFAIHRAEEAFLSWKINNRSLSPAKDQIFSPAWMETVRWKSTIPLASQRATSIYRRTNHENRELSPHWIQLELERRGRRSGRYCSCRWPENQGEREWRERKAWSWKRRRLDSAGASPSRNRERETRETREAEMGWAS